MSRSPSPKPRRPEIEPKAEPPEWGEEDDAAFYGDDHSSHDSPDAFHSRPDYPGARESQPSEPSGAAPLPAHPLDRYSTAGMEDELERQATATTPLFGGFIMNGQATLLFAGPNTGKTLITMHLLLDAAQSGRLAGKKVFYINDDDTSTGVAEKARLCAEAGVDMVVPGLANFKISKLRSLLMEAVVQDVARSTVIIIDSVKKVVDPMNKADSREFGALCRSYVARGGTMLALAHTRKNPDKDGEPVPQGTTDLREDFDAAYIGQLMMQNGDLDRRIVRFKVDKKRADAPNLVAFAYLDLPEMSYSEKVASVEPIDPKNLVGPGYSDVSVDEVAISVKIAALIGDGFDAGKMALSRLVAKECGISRSRATKIIEAKTGDGPDQLWVTVAGPHNKQRYILRIHSAQ